MELTPQHLQTQQKVLRPLLTLSKNFVRLSDMGTRFKWLNVHDWCNTEIAFLFQFIYWMRSFYRFFVQYFGIFSPIVPFKDSNIFLSESVIGVKGGHNFNELISVTWIWILCLKYVFRIIIFFPILCMCVWTGHFGWWCL